jgi:hypothetical protein
LKCQPGNFIRCFAYHFFVICASIHSRSVAESGV